MAALAGTFGIAVPNFTAYPQMPDIKALVDYGIRMEQLGFDSLWVWDHILLGVDPNFPIIESLTLLTAIAARTSRIKLGTGILVLPMRNPVILAKQLACMDLLSDGRLLMGMASGWYRARVQRHRRAVRAARQDHGREPRHPEAVLDRAHGERQISASRYSGGGDVSKAGAETDPHPDRRLRRSRAQARGYRRRRLAHLLLSTRELRQIVGEDLRFRQGSGQGSEQAPQCISAADLYRQVAGEQSKRR